MGGDLQLLQPMQLATVDLMLVQRLRRWSNIKSTVGAGVPFSAL